MWLVFPAAKAGDLRPKTKVEEEGLQRDTNATPKRKRRFFHDLETAEPMEAWREETCETPKGTADGRFSRRAQRPTAVPAKMPSARETAAKEKFSRPATTLKGLAKQNPRLAESLKR